MTMSTSLAKRPNAFLGRATERARRLKGRAPASPLRETIGSLARGLVADADEERVLAEAAALLDGLRERTRVPNEVRDSVISLHAAASALVALHRLARQPTDADLQVVQALAMHWRRVEALASERSERARALVRRTRDLLVSRVERGELQGRFASLMDRALSHWTAITPATGGERVTWSSDEEAM